MQDKLKFVISRFIFSGGLEAFIGGNRKEISLANLAKFPPFLRFDQVKLHYRPGSQSLIAKCLLFEDCLNSIKSALKDSNTIYFVANIYQDDPSDFSDHSSVIIYLRDILLPICNSDHRYVFEISFISDENSTTDVISSILQFPQVRSCSNVSFTFVCNSLQLPVEDISNWLAPKTGDGVEIYGKKQENRFPRLIYAQFENFQEMWEHLKEVKFFHNLVHFYS